VKKAWSKGYFTQFDADVHNPELYNQHFGWLITQFDKLRSALQISDKA
jgi:hypothetical protein